MMAVARGDVAAIQGFRGGAWRARQGDRAARFATGIAVSAGVAGEAIAPPWRGAKARARAGGAEQGGVVCAEEKNRGGESCRWGRPVSDSG